MSTLSEHYRRLLDMTEAERDAEIKRQVFGTAFTTFFEPRGNEILKGNADLVPAEHQTMGGEA